MIIMHHRLVLQTFLEKTNIKEKIHKIWGMGDRRGIRHLYLLLVYNFCVQYFSGLERGKFYENNQELK